MAGPLLYKSPPKWQVVVALFAAIALHGVAAVISAIRPPEPVEDMTDIPEAVVDLEYMAEQAEPEPTPEPEEEEEPEIEELPPTPTEEPEFVDERPTPTPRPNATPRTKPLAPITRPKPAGVPGAPRGPVPTGRAAMISRPTIAYPYEARRARATGSGSVIVSVSPDGRVTSSRMGKSTGNAILDNAAIAGMRSVRFRPGTASTVSIPITFTLTGAQY